MTTPEDILACIAVERLVPADQPAVRALILNGLIEHWGTLDPARNPDLEDLQAAYPGGTTLVARQADRIVGTGTLVPRSPGVAEIVRMSVARDWRRLGVGGLVLRELLTCARKAGCRKIILETTSTWTEAIAFYRRFGFEITHTTGGDTWFALDLPPAR
jgi:GNAT superfamily N-acetyltransferase